MRNMILMMMMYFVLNKTFSIFGDNRILICLCLLYLKHYQEREGNDSGQVKRQFCSLRIDHEYADSSG